MTGYVNARAQSLLLLSLSAVSIGTLPASTRLNNTTLSLLVAVELSPTADLIVEAIALSLPSPSIGDKVTSSITFKTELEYG